MCEGWRQYRSAVPVTLYNLVMPVQDHFVGDMDHLGEARVSMLWLVDGSVHLVSDYWQAKDLPAGEKKFLVLGSHEPVHRVSVRDWTKQLCLGYSWFRDTVFYGEKMPPRVKIGLTPAPTANFVKFKEWLGVAEG